MIEKLSFHLDQERILIAYEHGKTGRSQFMNIKINEDI